MEGEPQGLCVSRGNIYVTCSGSRLIKVLTGDAMTCLRSFKLQQDMLNPWHAIPLPDSDRFLVSHGLESGRLHRLCVVDNNGKVSALMSDDLRESVYPRRQPTHVRSPRREQCTDNMLFTTGWGQIMLCHCLAPRSGSKNLLAVGHSRSSL